MKANKRKIELAMARACMNSTDIAAQAQIPEVTVRKVISGCGTRARTLGRIAAVLGVDPAEIIEQED